jgi:uncharacterized iron-regulated membrane protein
MSHEPAVKDAVRLRRAVRQIHRWLGLLIAIQLLCWVAGGLIMSALRIDALRGETPAAQRAAPTLDPAQHLLSIRDVAATQPPGTVHSVTLTMLLEKPVYRLETHAGAMLIDAGNGQPLSPLPESTVRALALADYAGSGTLQGMDLIEVEELEIRGREVPLWRAQFDDDRHTTLYISPGTGAVVARRNDLWRVFDFVWMLHIMDYQQREDINHPLLTATAATALLFVTSGLWMLFYSFRRRTGTNAPLSGRGRKTTDSEDGELPAQSSTMPLA